MDMPIDWQRCDDICSSVSEMVDPDRSSLTIVDHNCLFLTHNNSESDKEGQSTQHLTETMLHTPAHNPRKKTKVLNICVSDTTGLQSTPTIIKRRLRLFD